MVATEPCITNGGMVLLEWLGIPRWILHFRPAAVLGAKTAIDTSSSHRSRHVHMWWNGFCLEWAGKTWGAYCLEGVAAASWAPNRLDCFLSLVATEPCITSGGMVCLSGWEYRGGYCISAPLLSWGAKPLDTFVIGNDHAMYYMWWNGSAWSGWENWGLLLEGVAAGFLGT